MLKFWDFFINIIMLIGVIAFFSNFMVSPMLLKQPLISMEKPVEKEKEHSSYVRFSTSYVIKTVLRYLVWGFAAAIIAFFFGGFILGVMNLLAKDIVAPFFERLRGLS